MELKEYIHIILKRFPIIIIITILAGLVSGVVSYFVLDEEYEASTSMIVSNQSNPEELDLNDINLYRNLVETYSEIAKSNNVLMSVKEALQTDLSVDDLRSKITVNGQGNTEIIKMKVVDNNPDQAALIANTLAVIFQGKVKDKLLLENVQILDEAQVPLSPVKPRPLLNIIIAILLGLMIGLGIVFLIEYFDNTIKTPEDVEKHLGLPVIGTIPNFDNLN